MLLLCNDEDVLPAIKEAKRNGIYVILGGFDIELSKNDKEIPKLNKKLKEHCDEVRVLDTTKMTQGRAENVYVLSDSEVLLL